MNTCELSIPARLPRTAAGRRRSGAARILELLELWHERAEHRRQLREMPEYLYRDIGISPADVHREVNKPFWRT